MATGLSRRTCGRLGGEHFRREESCKGPELGVGLVNLAGEPGEERCRGRMVEGPGLPSERDGGRWGV